MSDTHFEARPQVISMKEDGVESLNGEEALIVSSKTVGELASCLHIFTTYITYGKTACNCTPCAALSGND